MADHKIESFEQFWDFYVGEHKKKGTRILHFIGTTSAALCLAGGLFTKKRWLLLVAPVAGYGPAWIAHFLIEKNKPASFDYPLWSLRADLLMWWKTLTGDMQAEVDRIVREATARDEANVATAVVGETDKGTPDGEPVQTEREPLHGEAVN
jgi:hypothetical protein